MAEVATKVRKEIDLGDGSGKQVFEADNEAALNDKLAEAQTHATRKIREQAQEQETLKARIAELEAASAAPVEVPANGFDKNAYFSTMYEDPIKAQRIALEQLFGVPFEQIQETFGNAATTAQIVGVNAVNARFTQKHPELLQVTPEEDVHNSQVIDAICKENNWDWTDGHVEAAFLIAREQKKLKLPVQAEEVPSPTPVASIGNRGGGATSVAEADLLKGMTLEQKREYFSQKAARLRAAQ